MKQKRYRRLTLTDRCHIQSRLHTGISLNEIAKLIGVHRSTVCREIKRNLIWLYKYQAHQAHQEALKRRAHCHRKLSIQGDLEGLVIEGLFKFRSPEQIAGRVTKENFFSLSTQTIYNYIKKFEPDLAPCLTRYKKRGAGRFLQRKTNLTDGRIYISKRPKFINKRNQVGHWERDTIFCANRKQILLCVERKTRMIKLSKIPVPTAKNVTNITLRILKDSKLPINSITNDNGCEFIDGKNMDIPVYYCEPLKPHQRGSAENAAGILRRFLKRNTDISQLSDQDIRDIEDELNNRPRKILGFKTPNEAAALEMLH